VTLIGLGELKQPKRLPNRAVEFIVSYNGGYPPDRFGFSWKMSVDTSLYVVSVDGLLKVHVHSSCPSAGKLR